MKLPNVWKKWSGRLKFRDEVLGGMPRIEKQLPDFLEAKGRKGKEKEIKEDLDLVQEEEKRHTGFRSDGDGLYLHADQIKSAIKEWASNLRLYKVRGKLGISKLIQQTMVVTPTKISLSKKDPDGQHYHQGKVRSPQGDVSILSCFDYVRGAEISFEIKVVETCPLTHGDLLKCFALGQDTGIASLRTHGFGRFDLLELKEITE